MNVAVTVPLLPSSTVASPIEIAGNGSSSVIVPSALGSEMVPFSALERFSVNDSSISSSTSPFTATLRVFVVSPAAKVSVPLAAV